MPAFIIHASWYPKMELFLITIALLLRCMYAVIEIDTSQSKIMKLPGVISDHIADPYGHMVASSLPTVFMSTGVIINVPQLVEASKWVRINCGMVMNIY